MTTLRFFASLSLSLLLCACVSHQYRDSPPVYYPPSQGYQPPPPGYGHYGYPPPPVAMGPIAVARAIYGTWKRGCDATRVIASQASGRYHFQIEANNGLCGDPHQGKDKTLSVTYYCGGQVKEASAAEGQRLYMRCP